MDSTVNDTKPEDKERRAKYEIYLEERKLLIQAEKEGSQQFDKAILTLAAGALAISITFINQIAPHPKPGTICFLAWGWVAFGMSLISTLVSFFTSQKACRKQIAILEHDVLDKKESESNKQKNDWAIWTNYLNIVSILAFVIGVIFLGYFSISNIGSSKQEVVMSNGENKKQVEERGFVPQQSPRTEPKPESEQDSQSPSGQPSSEPSQE